MRNAVTSEPVGHMVSPRLQGKNLTHNLATVSFLKEMAARKSCTPAQLAVAWLLQRGEDTIPIIGMSRRSRLPENLAILEVNFSADEIAALERAFAPGAIRGDRYRAMVQKYAAQ
ncbi:MAG: aldo/keto reductase [Betaproteobacteria bacterium]|nr:aldo/keto reductase [Betaproteobacteria bacterium]